MAFHNEACAGFKKIRDLAFVPAPGPQRQRKADPGAVPRPQSLTPSEKKQPQRAAFSRSAAEGALPFFKNF